MTGCEAAEQAEINVVLACLRQQREAQAAADESQRIQEKARAETLLRVSQRENQREDAAENSQQVPITLSSSSSSFLSLSDSDSNNLVAPEDPATSRPRRARKHTEKGDEYYQEKREKREKAASHSRGGAKLPVRQSRKMRAKVAEMSQLLDGFKPDSSNRLA